MASASYEPPTIEDGSPLSFPLPEPEIYPGVRGYAIAKGNEIYIPLIEGEGTGQVRAFLDALSSRCVLVNVCSPKLRGMLERRGWQVSYDEEGVDCWRKSRE